MALQPVAPLLPAVQAAAIPPPRPNGNPDGVASAAPFPQTAAPSPVAGPTSPAQAEVKPARREDLERALDDVRKAVEPVARNLLFSIDEQSGRTVIKVVDSATKETIRQIPSEEILSIAKALDKLKGLLIKNEA